jgi:hypothetical protein
MEELRADGTQEILAMIRCRIVCLQFAIQTYIDRDIRKFNSACFLYGCDIRSLTLREEHSVLTTKEWKRLHNGKLYDLYSSPNIIRMIKSRIMRCAQYVARMEERRGAYRILVGKPEGNRPLKDLDVDGG